MAFFKICEFCGATLDPQEKCTCEQERKEAEEKQEIDKYVQITLRFIQQSKKVKRR